MNAWSRSIALSCLSIFVSLSTSAHAGFLYFAYSYTGNGIASAGLMTTTDVLVGGAYTITGIQGTRDVNNIGGLLAPGVFGGNDNLLFPGGPYVDGAGFSYLAGGLSYNVGNSATACGSVNLYAESNTGFCPWTAVFMNVTPLIVSRAPEPASILLLVAGLAGLGFSRRKQA
jgi:hypothetical protein